MQFVELPAEIQASLVGLVVALFALIVDYILGVLPPALGWLGDFLKKYQQEWALALGSALVVWLQNVLPSGYEDVSIKGITFILALIAAFVPFLLAHKALKERKYKAFQ